MCGLFAPLCGANNPHYVVQQAKLFGGSSLSNKPPLGNSMRRGGPGPAPDARRCAHRSRRPGRPRRQSFGRGPRYPARTGESEQRSSRVEQLERQQVDILVAARGPFSLGRGRRKLGRVEDDHVEGASLVAESAQNVKDIPFQPGGLILPEPVQANVFHAQRQGIRSKRPPQRTSPAPPSRAARVNPPV